MFLYQHVYIKSREPYSKISWQIIKYTAMVSYVHA